MHGQPGSVRVLPLQPQHDRRPARLALEQLGLQPDLGELGHDVLGRLALPWS